MSSIEYKPDGTIVVTARITLKPGRDDRLIEILETAPARGLASTIRESMRTGITNRPENFVNDDLDLSGHGVEI